MRITKKLSNKNSFTLIELLVVIAILAVLSVAVVFIINPADIIKQSRDTNRLTDLNNLNKALGVFDVTNPNDFTGTSSIVYVSLPDTSATCTNLSLPALPAGYTYNCVTSSTLSKADGTGWIPVNFTNVSYGSPINRLPIDPVNTSSTGEYYSYIVGGSWELNAILSSSKYRNDDDITKTNLPGVLSIGTDKTLNPVYTTTGLIAYYKFNDSSGTTLTDSVGGYTGTITQGQGGWTSNQKNLSGTAYEFDAATTKIDVADNQAMRMTGGGTISVWVYPESLGEGSNERIIDKSTDVNFTNGYGIYITSNNAVRVGINGSAANSVSNSNPFNLNSWNHIVAVLSSGGSKIYINGVDKTSTSGVLLPPDVAGGITIGNRNSLTDRTFDGRISDVRIYSRVLSAAEVQAIYNSTR